jgi:hypothetical protein
MVLPDRYTYQNFKKAVRNPEKFVEETKRLPSVFHEAVQKAWAKKNGYSEKDAVKLIEEDWDNLVIIDACRADLFEEVVDTDEFDRYKRVISLDTNTTPWSIKNFGGEHLGDTVYVTGNPAPSKTVPDEFHDFIEVWTDPDAHDENTYTVPPEPIVEAATEASEKYPDKRLIVHFIHPHIPFVEDPNLIYRTDWNDAERVGIEVEDPEPPHTVWEALRMGEVEYDEVWAAYRRNLEYVLPHVYGLIDELSGKTVLTSDHGNMLGERSVSGKRVYGHPGGMRCPQLLEVPWCEIEGDARKEIKDEGVNSGGSVESDLINDRLTALGSVE